MKKTILDEANEIIFGRTREKEGEYGPLIDSMKKSAIIATQLTNKDLTTDDMYKCAIAMKMARMAYKLKHDTFLDTIGYIAGNYDFLDKEAAIEEADKNQLKIEFEKLAGSINTLEERRRSSIPSMDLRQWFWDMKMPFNPADYASMEKIYREAKEKMKKEWPVYSKRLAAKAINSNVTKSVEENLIRFESGCMTKQEVLDKLELSSRGNQVVSISDQLAELHKQKWDEQEAKYYKSVADNEPDTHYTIE